jgi:hypothetical protein
MVPPGQIARLALRGLAGQSFAWTAGAAPRKTIDATSVNRFRMM